jgi:hypothetical protein
MRKILIGLFCAAAFLASSVSHAAEALKILGQVNPAATTATTLYTVPASTQAVVSTIVVANQAASQATFRISIRVAGAAANAKQYIAYDVAVPANDSIILTLGIALATTDIITVYGSSANLSFTATGSEIS